MKLYFVIAEDERVFIPKWLVKVMENRGRKVYEKEI